MVNQNGTDYCQRMSHTYPYIDPLKLNLRGKSVFITGASKGLGAALALSYAKAGASIIGIASRSSHDDLVKAMRSAAIHAARPDPKVFAYAMDVTNPESVEKAAARFAIDCDGHLDILVNNAGYLSQKPILDSDPTDWWMNWEVNVKGVYLSTKYLLPIMLKDPKSDKTVINLSSAGAHNIRPGGSAYGVTKHAITRFTEFIGVEYGDQGVLAYSVHPGSVATDMGNKFAAPLGITMDDDPDVCGETVPFLTSEKREWLQGRYVACTWNMEEFLKKKDDIIANDYLKVRMRIG